MLKPTGRMLWDTLTVLSTRLPLGRPVTLSTHKKLAWHGATWTDRRGFHIAIRREHRELMFDTLIHEWAHARAWPSRSEHGDRWGVEYARAYRVVMESGFPKRGLSRGGKGRRRGKGGRKA